MERCKRLMRNIFAHHGKSPVVLALTARLTSLQLPGLVMLDPEFSKAFTTSEQ